MHQRRWFWRLSVLTVVLALTLGTLVMHALQSSSVVAIQSSIHAYTPLLTGLRLTVIGLIAYLWPRLIQYAHQTGRIQEERKTALLSLRWQTVGWLLIIELLLAQNLLGRLTIAMGWAGA